MGRSISGLNMPELPISTHLFKPGWNAKISMLEIMKDENTKEAENEIKCSPWLGVGVVGRLEPQLLDTELVEELVENLRWLSRLAKKRSRSIINGESPR